LVRGGDADAGAAEARRATALLDGADSPVIRAEALLALAEACDAAGDAAAASAARDRVAGECSAKGYLVARDRADGLGRGLGPPAAVGRREDDDLDVALLELLAAHDAGIGRRRARVPG